MKKIFLLITTILLLTQCDDGNFDTPSFVFENEFDNCGDIIIFNIGIDDAEAIILDIPDINNEENIFFKTEWENKEYDLTDKISYRVFDGAINNDYFCQDIPQTSPTVVNEWNGSGLLIVNNIITKDDKDGIIEDVNALDTDGDLIPNYLDKDDDNDGVLTIKELYPEGVTAETITDADGDNFLDYLDTDGDGIFNYLEEDDDNDGILTINEINDDNSDEIPDYLDGNISAIQSTSGTVAPNNYNLHYSMSFIIENMSLLNNNGNSINYSNYEYGNKTGDIPIE